MYPEGPPSGEQRASPVPRVLVIIATLNEGTQENFEATMKANFEGQRAKEDSCLFASFFHSTTDQMQFVWIECFDSGDGQKAHGGTEWAKAFFAFRPPIKASRIFMLAKSTRRRMNPSRIPKTSMPNYSSSFTCPKSSRRNHNLNFCCSARTCLNFEDYHAPEI